MCKSLPLSGFTWLEPGELNALHEKHYQFPLAQVSRLIEEPELSEYSREHLP